MSTTTAPDAEPTAPEDGPGNAGSTRLVEAILDNLPAWTVIAAAIAFLYLVWATIEISVTTSARCRRWAPDMATVESSVTPPAPGWARKLPADEKIFLWMVAFSVVVMSAFTIGWIFVGHQNTPTASFRTTPAAFSAKTQAFATKYTQQDGRVHVPVGTDAYLMAYRFAFYPTLVVKAGHPVRIWLSSVDALHGFSIVGHNLNINLEVAPNHAYGAVFTPTEPGKYLVVCNEYCGLGHQEMQTTLYVER